MTRSKVPERNHRDGALASQAAPVAQSSQPGTVAEKIVVGSSGATNSIVTLADGNSVAGARRTPAKVIPVPDGLDPVERSLIAGPYSPFWNLAPADAAAWRAIQQDRAEASAPVLALLRSRFGVAIAPACYGGVNGYMLSPSNLAKSSSGQLVFYLHGGGYVLGQGESGTLEAVLMAAYSGYRVLCVDYSLAPQAPYPAALDDAVAAWCGLIKDVVPNRIAVAGISAGGGLALALMLRLKAE